MIMCVLIEQNAITVFYDFTFKGDCHIKRFPLEDPRFILGTKLVLPNEYTIYSFEPIDEKIK